MEKRNRDLDAIKGFLIILVIVGHCIQSILQSKCDNNIIFRVIYSFHMPLFMFISGAVASYAVNISRFEWIWKRFKGLVIPFVSWIVIFYLFGREWYEVTIISKIANVFLCPDSGYWFLWVLFLNCIILYTCSRLAEKLGGGVFGLVVLLAVCLHVVGIPFDYFGIGLCTWHITFFLSGYNIKKYFFYFKLYKKGILVLCICLFLITAVFWNRVGEPLFIPILNEQFIWSMIPQIIRKILIKVVYEYAVPFLGIATVCLGIKYIKLKWMKQILARIGYYTLEIYILHGFFIKMIQTKFIVVNVILNTVLALILSFIIAYILGKNRFLGNILFGKSGKVVFGERR